MTYDLFEFEREYSEKGIQLIAGIDEAGRGPLAGPVVVASVILPITEQELIPGINDSKKLSEKKREKLFDLILEKAIDYHIAIIDEKVIDEINILNATKRGMRECIDKLAVRPEIVFIDAVKIDATTPTVSIIKGDLRSYNIAAASILAKVTRDRIMCEYAEKYPEYGFEKHKGYGTKQHTDALREIGPCPIHRRTFIGNFVKP